MIWFLLIVAGGSTSQSGIGIDTRQTFPTEAECIATRDQVLAISSADSKPRLTATGHYQPAYYQRLLAHCVSRPARTGQE